MESQALARQEGPAVLAHAPTSFTREILLQETLPPLFSAFHPFDPTRLPLPSVVLSPQGMTKHYNPHPHPTVPGSAHIPIYVHNSPSPTDLPLASLKPKKTVYILSLLLYHNKHAPSLGRGKTGDER